MLYSTTEIAELVCTRISHDFGGNIGALGSALELIDANNGVLDSDTRSIITTATETLKARQKFLRIAFGSETKSHDSTELKNICEAYLATLGNPTTPIKLATAVIAPEIARLIFLSVMIMADVCVRGGEIRIDMNQKNMIIQVKSNYKLTATKIATYCDIIAGKKPQEYESQYIQLIYLRELLGADVNMKITASTDEMMLVIG